MQIKTKIVSSHTADSKPVKQEVNGTVILPPLVFPDYALIRVNYNYADKCVSYAKKGFKGLTHKLNYTHMFILQLRQYIRKTQLCLYTCKLQLRRQMRKLR